MAPSTAFVSIVVPVYDEEESLPLLHAEIVRHVGGMGVSWEVIYVDDHSTDSTPAVLAALAAEDSHVRVLRFRRNYGQTAAMSAGFEHTRGDVVVTLDADLQNDPADIPQLVAKLDEGFDVVVGWRKDRRDGFVLRRLPSIVANRLIGLVTGVSIHDTGCTLKAFRRELVDNMPIYAEQHRFLPVLSRASGARLTEMVVNHRARQFGASKYGIGRATRVALDLLTVKMISSFSRHPLRYFAWLAVPFVLGIIVLGVSAATSPHFALDNRWGQSVLILGLICAMTCAFFLMLGLLAELAIRVSTTDRSNVFGPLTSRSRA